MSRYPVNPRVLLLSALLLIAPPGSATSRVEVEGAVATATLLQGRVALRGDGYRLDEKTPVREFMGRYRIETDVGTIEAVGVDELALRVDELPAVRRLLAIERSDMFAQALQESAKSAGTAVARVVTQPGETLAALPAGIGRALLSAGRRVRGVAVRISDAAQREESPAEAPAEANEETSETVTDFAAELAGVNKARRAIARDLGIDPYTRNPLAEVALTRLAWASVAGGLSLDIALAAVPRTAREAISAAGRIDELAWDLPPADIQRQLEQRLTRRGHAGRTAREMLRNPALSPTDQLRLVAALEQIDVREGEAEVLRLATSLRRPRYADFLIRQLQLLAGVDAREPLARYRVEAGMVWASTRNAGALVPLPLDQLSWTAPLAKALDSPREQGALHGRLQVTGSVSALARKQLAAAGWRVDTVNVAER